MEGHLLWMDMNKGWQSIAAYDSNARDVICFRLHIGSSDQSPSARPVPLVPGKP
jgi:hypothetical protein